MEKNNNTIGYHEQAKASQLGAVSLGNSPPEFKYTFENFFHPFVGELISTLNSESLPGILDAAWQESLEIPDFFQQIYGPNPKGYNNVTIKSFPKEIDVETDGPYANYNWELFFHIPLTIAVHLSKTQRFAEAQRWFHYVFDPTSHESVGNLTFRFWKFLAFRKEDKSLGIDEILRLLSTPRGDLKDNDPFLQDAVMRGYTAILKNPFQPHKVARTRPLAYQYWVVMRYLDNLIAWGDHLFQQDTVESINEATQRYVLAANLLGPRPQRIPDLGATRSKTFAELKQEGLGPIGNAMVDLESQFPFNLALSTSGSGDGNGAGSLFGIGRALYFSVPRNEKMLEYWDTVADRLFKIRHSMSIAGVTRSLALFDPPINPGLLVKAAAAGIDVGSVVNGLNQPVGPVRCLLLIQKALELCNEVRSLGGALLSAIEKGDAERLSLIRQRHEIQIQKMAQDVRFLQWQSAQEATKSLLTSRATALERLHYYQRVLGLPEDINAQETLTLEPSELNEQNFETAYKQLVAQYDKQMTLQKLPSLKIAGKASPARQSGASGQGSLYLNTNEDKDLNVHGPLGHVARQAAIMIDTIHAPLSLMPEMGVDLHYWGLGGHATVFGGSMLVTFGRQLSAIANMVAAEEEAAAARASKTAGFERRADEWMFQYNLAAHDLMQIGRQILTSLIAEQVARHEYLNIKRQIDNDQEVDQFLHDKFTNEELHLWMQGEISRLYYEYYRFAFDTARKAERTMKQELMRPELDAQDFIKFNYWDGGRKGLLCGEALHLDVKRMEMAYYDNNKRELELTRHVSLRQLDPLALLTLKATGTCQVTIPEWLYDLDCPGHYMRRIKSVALTIPSVVGPYTSVSCALSLLKSSLRKSPLPKDGEYARQGSEDDRFVDYSGAIQSIVTSGAVADGGLFETNLRDERFLPFEGAGAESAWKLELPNPQDYPAFDYATISDVILHVRYTARQGVDQTKVKTALDNLFQHAGQSNLALLFSLRHDFSMEWAAFVNGANAFAATIRKDYFPYFTQGKQITITGLDLYKEDMTAHHSVGDPAAATSALAGQQLFTLTAAPDQSGPNQVLPRDGNARVFLIVRYSL
jgi:hypothetical protein